MKKLKKTIILVATLLVVLVVVLLVLAKTLITPDRVQQALLPIVEEKLNRKVEMGQISVSLFSGIELRDLKIFEQDGSVPFVATDLVRLKYQLLPLLAMKVVVDEVRLEKPQIRIVRLKEGLYNFSDLMAESGPEEGSAASVPVQTPGSAVEPAPISLLVSQVVLQDGQLVFVDHVLNDAVPYRYELSELQFAAKGVSLVGQVPVSLQCRLNGGQFSLEGQVGLSPLKGDFKMELQGMDIVAFKPYFQSALPGKLGGMKLNVSSTISGTTDQLSLDGSLSLTDVDLLLDAMPEASLKNANLTTEYSLNYSRQEDAVQMRRLDVDFNGIQAKASGGISGLSTAPVLDLAVEVPKLEIRKALKAIPQGLVGDIASFDPAGTVAVTASLAGAVNDVPKLIKSAGIELDNVQATAAGQRPALSGRIALAGSRLSSENLHVRVGDNQADIRLEADNVYGKPIVVSTDIASKRFVLDSLLAGNAGAALATDQGGGTGAAAEKPSAAEMGPFDLPLRAKGTIAVAEALWKGLIIKDFLADYELKDNIFTLTRLDGRVADGSFSNSARVDLGKKGLAYTARLDLRSIKADPLLKALAPEAAGSLSGTADLALDLAGQGTLWDTIKRTLSGNGNLSVADGRLINPKLVNGLSVFLQTPDLKEIRFDTFEGKIKIVDGKVVLDSRILSETLKIYPKGAIGLDSSLNLALDTRLSPAMTARLDKRGGFAGYLADDDGWTRVPVLLKGSFDSPRFGLDPQAVKEQAGRLIGNELGRQLEKLNKRNGTAQQQPDGTQPATEDPAQKLLQDSLKKLFGN